MGFVLYNMEDPQLAVWWEGNVAHSVWLTDFRHPKIPRYMYPENITFHSISRFCESRQPPRNRVGIDYLLQNVYGLTEYQPIAMCRISRGITHSDDLWMLFEGQERVPYASITVR